ncbi:hypothetical protein OROMI_025489 [Orobanche minor]
MGRYRWVPAFVKDCFWAGMSTTQRSESMNAFFDGFVHSKTTLKEFVEQYENAFRKKAEIELVADYRSCHTVIPLISQFEFEKQFQLVYTSEKFKEVQSETARKMECIVTSLKECGIMTEFDVEQYVSVGDNHRHVEFRVRANESWDEVKCNCQLFEFIGILCRHIFSAMTYKKIYHVSDKYILGRWSKIVKRNHTHIRICYDNWTNTPEGRRFDMMSNLFHGVVDLAMESVEGCEDVMDSLHSMNVRLKNREAVCGSNQPKSITYKDFSASHSYGTM